jgi:hypothetical protein
MRTFQLLTVGLCLLLSLCASPSTAAAQQSPFAAKAPTGWTVVERSTIDQQMQQKKSLIDFVGGNYPYPGPKAANFTQQELAVAITVRSTDAEGGSLDDYVADYLETAGGPPGPSFKPYRIAFFRGGGKTYYSVDRLVKPIQSRSNVVVGGEKGVAFVFAATVHSNLPDDFTEHDGKIKQVIVKHGSDIFVFTLSSFGVVFARDEAVFDTFLQSVRWR